MSRVNSHDTKHSCISGFFAQYSSPSALLDADSADIYAVLIPPPQPSTPPTSTTNYSDRHNHNHNHNHNYNHHLTTTTTRNNSDDENNLTPTASLPFNR